MTPLAQKKPAEPITAPDSHHSNYYGANGTRGQMPAQHNKAPQASASHAQPSYSQLLAHSTPAGSHQMTAVPERPWSEIPAAPAPATRNTNKGAGRPRQPQRNRRPPSSLPRGENQQSQQSNWQTMGRRGRKLPANFTPEHQPGNGKSPGYSKKTPKYNLYLDEVQRLKRHGTFRHADSKCTIKDEAGDLLLHSATKGQAVGADFAMNAGLAKHTKNHYQLNTEDLLAKNPNAKPGHVAPVKLKDGSEMLLLVSKPVSTQKLHHDPDGHVEGAREMVRGLAKYTAENGIKELALPYLCSGLDGLDRFFVRQMFLDAFRLQDIVITFLSFKPRLHRRRWQAAGNASGHEDRFEDAVSDF